MEESNGAKKNKKIGPHPDPCPSQAISMLWQSLPISTGELCLGPSTFEWGNYRMRMSRVNTRAKTIQ